MKSIFLRSIVVLMIGLASHPVFSEQTVETNIIETAEIKVLKMPSKGRSGEILVYKQDSRGQFCSSDNCAERYELAPDFTTQINGQLSPMRDEFFLSLPRQAVSLTVFEEGVVQTVDFINFVMPEVEPDFGKNNLPPNVKK